MVSEGLKSNMSNRATYLMYIYDSQGKYMYICMCIIHIFYLIMPCVFRNVSIDTNTVNMPVCFVFQALTLCV